MHEKLDSFPNAWRGIGPRARSDGADSGEHLSFVLPPEVHDPHRNEPHLGRCAVCILGSEQLDAVLMEIMQSGCLLSGLRIDKQTFETAEGREYYLPCAEEVGVRTLAPFFKHAGSLLSGLGSLTKTPSQT